MTTPNPINPGLKPTWADKFKTFIKKATILIPAIVTTASVITASIPDPNPDSTLAAVHQFLDVLSLNIGQNAHNIGNDTGNIGISN